MSHRDPNGKVNVKLLVILIVIATALVVSLVAARQIRRSILSKMSLQAGEEAFANGDWPAACKNLQEYLGRNPDDLEILKKYAKAQMAIRPLERRNIMGAISAYRRVLQLSPVDDVAYDRLAELYHGVGDYENLAYIARLRLEHDPNNRKAPLWLANALQQQNKPEEARKELQSLIDKLEPLRDRDGEPNNGEYVQACLRMSKIAALDDSAEERAKALEWLDKAVGDPPQSVEALATRAQFYRETSDISDVNGVDRQTLARRDLEAADKIGTDKPLLRLFLGSEWLEHNEPDRAAAELKATDALPREVLDKYFFDPNDWEATKYLFASQLATQRQDTAQGVSLADEALGTLTEKRHRVRVLLIAIPVYAVAKEAEKARKCLDEYLGLLRAQQGPRESPEKLAWLEALVETAEEKPYQVIDTLQPVVVGSIADPDIMGRIWRLLIDAFNRTGQHRREVSALTQYLRAYPGDVQMIWQLAREYLRLGDWSRALETARLVERLNPTAYQVTLLRIEAEVNTAVQQQQKPTADIFTRLSDELTPLRAAHPDRADIRVLQAIIALNQEQPDKAEAELKGAIEQCQEPLQAEMQLARCYYGTKRTAEAVEVCRAMCRRHPETAEPWLFFASLRLKQEDYAAAHDCLEQGLKAVVAPAEKRSVSIELARLDLTHGDRAAGIQRLNDLAAQDNQEVVARSLLLAVPEVQADQVKAQGLIDELQKIEGQSGLQWRVHQARLWLSSDKWRSRQQEITSLLQTCIGSDPQWSAPALLLANLYEKSNDLRRAEDICRQALARNPSATDVADKLLAMLEKQGRFADAEKVLQQIQMNPRRASDWEVRMAMRTGDFARAIDELKPKVSGDDRDANSRIVLAQLIYQQRKDPNQAFQYLKEAEAIDPNSGALAWAKASILQAEGRTEEARRILDEYVAKRGDFAAYNLRASYLVRARQLEQAEADYQKLTTFPDQAVTGYRLLSTFYFKTGRLDKAVSTLETGLQAHADNQQLQRDLIELLLRRAQGSDRERAVKILGSLEKQLSQAPNRLPQDPNQLPADLKLLPQDPELLKLRARLLSENKNPPKGALDTAKALLENVVKLEPTDVDAYRRLAILAMRASEYPNAQDSKKRSLLEEARDYAIRGLGANPDNPALLSARAWAELALQNAPMAIELTRLALQRDPNNEAAIDVLVKAAKDSENSSLLEEIRTRIEAAYQSAKTEDPNLLLRAASLLTSLNSPEIKKEGLKLFERAAALLPESMDAHLRWASALYQAGEADRALTMYQELLAQHPDNLQVLNDLAWILQEHYQRYEEALKLADKALELKPDDPHLLDTRGTILSQMSGRLADARNDFAKLVQLSASNSRRQAAALLHLGRLCMQLKDTAQAKEHLQTALEIDRQQNVLTPDERAEIARILALAGTQARE